MEEEIVYIHLNNWRPGEDYPHAEPFLTWMKDDTLKFTDEEWVKENKLCVVLTSIDMSFNFDITATKTWVMENCPKLLSDEIIYTSSTSLSISKYKEEGTKYIEKAYPYSRYLCHPEEDDDGVYEDEVYDKFGIKFLPYKEENFGVTNNGDYVEYYDDDDDEEE